MNEERSSLEASKPVIIVHMTEFKPMKRGFTEIPFEKSNGVAISTSINCHSNLPFRKKGFQINC